ncbi:IS91 family transposase [Thiospirochaeta perfilievii]|uniref:IS91 family transposase n=1 Tax=Thiospirochaeta perfilievii TaxID=252967 RepID=A0A5C1QCG2_9SPIO|nr:IS91 family transposase [Thiospirochaeta perfilievii]
MPPVSVYEKEAWITKKKEEIFPYQYFHVVFTLPSELDAIVLRNKKTMYNLLFSSAKQALLSMAGESKYLGADIGFFSILHTWGQKLNLHPHLHCVVPGGGYSKEKRKWIKCSKNYLIPVEPLKQRFRSIFLKELKILYKNDELFLGGCLYADRIKFQKLIDQLFSKNWVVYLKESFNNSSTVIEYLARYTHRIAISNYRIINVDNDNVSFLYKDYKEGNKKKLYIMNVMDFISSFMLHIVPSRFVRIRYYGLMSNRNKKSNLQLCREYYDVKIKPMIPNDTWDKILLDVTGIDIHKCPNCNEGQLVLTNFIPSIRYRPPPTKTA